MSNISQGGTTSPQTTTVDYGSQVTLTAQPQENYFFNGWYQDGQLVSNDSEYHVTATKDTQITGVFKGVTLENKYKVSAVPSNSDYGSCSISPDQEYFNEGDVVTMTATPAEGYVFVNWRYNNHGTWVALSSDETYNHIVKKSQGDIEIQAQFALKNSGSYKITFDLDEACSNMDHQLDYNTDYYFELQTKSEQASQWEHGTVTANQIQNGITITQGYYYRFGVQFEGSGGRRYMYQWQVDGEDVSANGGIMELHPTKDTILSIKFTDTIYLVNITSIPENGMVWPRTNAYLRYIGYYSASLYYPTVNANASSGYKFVKWVDTTRGIESTNPHWQIDPVRDENGKPTNQTVELECRFEQQTFTVTTDVKPTSNGLYGGTVQITNPVHFVGNKQYVSVKATPKSADQTYTYKFHRYVDGNGKSLGVNPNLTLQVLSDMTIYACFKATNKTTGEEFIYPIDTNITFATHKPIIANTQTTTFTTSNVFTTICEDDNKLTGENKAYVKVELDVQEKFANGVPKGLDVIPGILVSVYHKAELPVGMIGSLQEEQIDKSDPDVHICTGRRWNRRNIVINNSKQTIVLNDLEPSSVYFIRPFVANEISVCYGEEVTVFTQIFPSKKFSANGLTGIFAVQPSRSIHNSYHYIGAIHRSNNSSQNVQNFFDDDRRNRRYGTLHTGYPFGNQNSLIENAMEYVIFSKGNLTYSHDNQFGFHSKQYDAFGENQNLHTSSSSDEIDLFCWGTSGFVFNLKRQPFSRFHIKPGDTVGGKTWSGYMIESTYDVNPYDDETVIEYTMPNFSQPQYAHITRIPDEEYIWMHQDAKDALYYESDETYGTKTGVVYGGLIDFSNVSGLESYGAMIPKYDPQHDSSNTYSGGYAYDIDIYDRYRYLHFCTNPMLHEQEIAGNITFNNQIFQDTGLGFPVNPDSDFRCYLDSNTGFGPSHDLTAMFQKSTSTGDLIGDETLIGNQYGDQDHPWAVSVDAHQFKDFMYNDDEVEGMDGLWGGIYPYQRSYRFTYATKNFDWGWQFDNEWRVMHDDFVGARNKYDPSDSEFDYFKKAHPMCKACIQDGQDLINGYIVLPMNWRDSYGIDGKMSIDLVSQNSADDTVLQIESKAIMDELTKYGVLFLPCAGFSNGREVVGSNEVPAYWTGSLCDGVEYKWITAADMILGSSGGTRVTVDGTIYQINKRNIGKAVRLVKDITDDNELTSGSINIKPDDNKNKYSVMVSVQYEYYDNGILKSRSIDYTQCNTLEQLMNLYQISISYNGSNLSYDKPLGVNHRYGTDGALQFYVQNGTTVSVSHAFPHETYNYSSKAISIDGVQQKPTQGSTEDQTKVYTVNKDIIIGIDLTLKQQ